MMNQSAFDGQIKDIFATINPRAQYAQVYSPNSPVNSTNLLNSGVERLLQNRVQAPITEEQDKVKVNISKIIEEAQKYIGKTKKNTSLERQRYIDGIKESLNIMGSYIDSEKNVYDILDEIRNLIIVNQQVYSRIILKSKPFYAGLISGLLNFIDVLADEIRAKEITESSVSIAPVRQINLPDRLFDGKYPINNVSNEYPK